MKKKLPSLYVTLLASLFASCGTSTDTDAVDNPTTVDANTEKKKLEFVQKLSTSWSGTAKLENKYNNPILDFNYIADPTAIEYNNRLYVFGSNDQQQCDETSKTSENKYDHIKTIAVMSTADMVNWTWHGIINPGEKAPWIGTTWAPSVVSRIEDKGMQRFYMYFVANGGTTGVLTASNPLGPWTSPLDKPLVGGDTPGLDGAMGFDPGAVIDSKGQGWLAVGGMNGESRLYKLDNMTNVYPSAVHLPAPYHFEANELNCIGDTWVFTYCSDWSSHEPWTVGGDKSSACSMDYMTTKTPEVASSWIYQGEYFLNPGRYGYDYGNNHTHLHKFRDHWYIFYHTQSLQHYLGATGGYRSLAVDEIQVDESSAHISLGKATNEGVSQLKTVNPENFQQMETTAGTNHVRFVAEKGDIGNMLATTSTTGSILVKRVEFKNPLAKFIVRAKGKGRVEVHFGSPEGKLVGVAEVDNEELTDIEGISRVIAGTFNLCFVFSGSSLQIDSWKFGD